MFFGKISNRIAESTSATGWDVPVPDLGPKLRHLDFASN
jgi:hypothetical protein